MEKTSPPPPAQDQTPKTDPTKVRIELVYNMLTAQMQMKSGSPTVVIFGVLRRAALERPKELAQADPGAPRRIIIDYDLATDECSVASDCSLVIHLGVLELAVSMVGQNQLLQRMQQQAGRRR